MKKSEDGFISLENFELLKNNDSDNDSLEPGEVPYETFFNFETKKIKTEVEENEIDLQDENLPLKECYVNLHRGVDSKEISRCRKCRKLDLKLKYYDERENSMEIDKEGNIDKEDNQQNNRYNYDSTDGSQDENENFNSEDEINYECQYCFKKYIHKASYKDHLRKKHDFNYFKKKKKQPESSSNQDLPKKTTVQKYNCFLCFMEFSDPAIYLQHLTNHENPKSKSRKSENSNFEFVCNYCKRKFESKKKLERHVLKHKDREKPFKCSECNLKFCTEFGMKNHLGEIHKVKVFKCDICGFMSNNFYSIKNHKKLKHVMAKEVGKNDKSKAIIVNEEMLVEEQETNEIQGHFKCNICSKFFILKKDLNLHLGKHLTGESELNSDLATCNLNFQSKSKIDGEITFETQSLEKDEFGVLCSYCGKILPSVQGLQRHKIKFHDHNLICQHCKETFQNLEEKTEHIKVNHSKQSCKKCNICQREFKTFRNMRRHQITVHTNICYPCVNCEKSFKHEQSLKFHLKKCSEPSAKNIRPIIPANNTCNRIRECIVYVCKECGKNFQKEQELDKHLVLAHFPITDSCDCGNCDGCNSGSTSNSQDSFFNLPNHSNKNQIFEEYELEYDGKSGKNFVDTTEETDFLHSLLCHEVITLP